MKKDVSIILPSIRPQFLETVYAAFQDSCKEHTWELVITTPFDIPTEIKRRNNVKVLTSHAPSTVALQMALQMCNAEFIHDAVDDHFELPGTLDGAIRLHKETLTSKDVVNMPYIADSNVIDKLTLNPKSNIVAWPEVLWNAWHFEELRKPGIKSDWKLAPIFVMKLDYLLSIGGFDCRYEYWNHPLHDLMFRVQADGGKIVNYTDTCAAGTHYPGHDYDHGPVHDAQLGPDINLFNSVYEKEDGASSRIKINYDNWKDQPDVWERRFNKEYLPITREEYDTQMKITAS